MTKAQIFNSVYGLFNEDIDENVVESHISKLRKRLRHRLGYDPIQSQRYLGYTPRAVLMPGASGDEIAASRAASATKRRALVRMRQACGRSRGRVPSASRKVGMVS